MLAGIDYIAEKTRQAIEVHEEDYTGTDGLLYCGKCRTPKQCRIEILGQIRIPYCLCKCEEEHDRRIQEEMNQERTERLRRDCFPDADMCQWQFASDDGTGDQKALSAMKNYAEKFKIMQEKQLGLLVYGDVGVGKSFAAACVANTLLTDGYSVKWLSAIQIGERGFFRNEQEQEEYTRCVTSPDLLILDDLGAERQTDFTAERIHSLINTRILTNKPMLVTTNLTPDQLTNTGNVQKNRIFSRLFKMTVPVQYTGSDRRKKIMKQNFHDVKDLLGL
ncbi:MAG: ATP-binding protein [Oscillospiraceae bacterium]|nr:ATP-binding protein [Oscillospiraceae bacterium]